MFFYANIESTVSFSLKSSVASRHQRDSCVAMCCVLMHCKMHFTFDFRDLLTEKDKANRSSLCNFCEKRVQQRYQDMNKLPDLI